MQKLKQLFTKEIFINENVISFEDYNVVKANNQNQTSDIFSDKWIEAAEYDSIDKMYTFQLDWFLKLYGFNTKQNLVDFLKDKHTIIDTGCGLGYKAAWFAELAPHAIVMGTDISDAINVAAKNYANLPNLYFFRGDIASTGLKDGVIDFTVCDQVIMHTEIPEKTFKHLCDITSVSGEFACYVYSKKALPRELVDDYFRKATHTIPNDKMWELSSQLTELGKTLSDLKVNFTCPDIPALGMKRGEYIDIQRFIYWNFLKCFWKEDWGFDLSEALIMIGMRQAMQNHFSKEEF
ncbi:MAG: methyltransferase domain-containing protein [Saprospiraceae bacterium]|nr:methyltransferase domain-containing protein [Saprospiraceae bacterium]